MKKFLNFITCLIAVFLIPLTAAAAPKFWHHNDYDLSKIDTVIVNDIDIKSESSGSFVSEQNIEDSIMSSIYAAAEKKDLLIVRADDYEADDTILAEETKPTKKSAKNKKVLDKVKLNITVNKLGYTYKTIPAHYENKIEYVKSQVKDSNGGTKDVQVPVPYQKYVPEITYYNAYLEVIYNVYDPETNTLIFNCRDYRYRSDTYGTSGMLERTGKDLIKNILKSK